LEVAKVIGDAKTVAAAQLRFDRLHLRVFRNQPEMASLQNAHLPKDLWEAT
jgi:hypothetical protein